MTIRLGHVELCEQTESLCQSSTDPRRLSTTRVRVTLKKMNQQLTPGKKRRTKRRKKRDLFVQREKTDKLLCLKWNDRKPVHFLSTIHNGDVVRTGKVHHRTKKVIQKPDVVTDYIQNMRLVDKCDGMLSGVGCLRKSTMWYQKFFFHMVDICMLNAYNYWLVKNAHDPTKKMKLREFVYNVVFQLLEEFGEPTSSKRGARHAAQPDRLAGAAYVTRHQLIYNEAANGNRTRLDCYVCKHTTRRQKKRTRVWTKCSECNTALCAVGCFAEYHTRKEF